jgi:hypothetical protein
MTLEARHNCVPYIVSYPDENRQRMNELKPEVLQSSNIMLHALTPVSSMGRAVDSADEFHRSAWPSSPRSEVAAVQYSLIIKSKPVAESVEYVWRQGQC